MILIPHAATSCGLRLLISLLSNCSVHRALWDSVSCEISPPLTTACWPERTSEALHRGNMSDNIQVSRRKWLFCILCIDDSYISGIYIRFAQECLYDCFFIIQDIYIILFYMLISWNQPFVYDFYFNMFH